MADGVEGKDKEEVVFYHGLPVTTCGRPWLVLSLTVTSVHLVAGIAVATCWGF